MPLRAGSDIAFLGGVINYILSNELDFREYVARVHERRRSSSTRTSRTPRTWTGCSAATTRRRPRYDPATGSYEGAPAGTSEQADGARRKETAAGDQHGSGGAGARGRHPDRPPTRRCEHPRCVYQILKRHFARYTPEMVEEVCGAAQGAVPRGRARRGRRTPAGSAPRRWSTRSGWTQHSVGVQYIRTAAIIQLLLGNMGRPGGGIMAMRGHASIQGSTDIPTLFNLLPGYLPMPSPRRRTAPRRATSTACAATNQKGFWRNADAYVVSLLKEYWGDAATAENDFCFDYLPRITGDHGTYRTVMDMVDGKVFGYFLLGQNPAVGSAHGRLQRLGMANLDWLVVRDLAMIESATFWKDSPEIETGEIVPGAVPHRGVLLPRRVARGEGGHLHPDPADAAVAGEGGRAERRPALRAVVLLPPGPAAQGAAGRPRTTRATGRCVDLAWDYEVHGDEPSAESRAARASTATGRDRQLVDGYLDLKADGSTSCGCWIYSGVYADGVNQAARRKPRDRAGRRPRWSGAGSGRTTGGCSTTAPRPTRTGRPWSERKALVWWDEDGRRVDRPRRAGLREDEAARPTAAGGRGGPGRAARRRPVRHAGRRQGLAVRRRAACWTGRCPRHYEPHESPFRNALYGQQGNPTRKVYGRVRQPVQPVAAGGALRGLPVRASPPPGSPSTTPPAG